MNGNSAVLGGSIISSILSFISFQQIIISSLFHEFLSVIVCLISHETYISLSLKFLHDIIFISESLSFVNARTFIINRSISLLLKCNEITKKKQIT